MFPRAHRKSDLFEHLSRLMFSRSDMSSRKIDHFWEELIQLLSSFEGRSVNQSTGSSLDLTREKGSNRKSAYTL